MSPVNFQDENNEESKGEASEVAIKSYNNIPCTFDVSSLQKPYSRIINMFIDYEKLRMFSEAAKVGIDE